MEVNLEEFIAIKGIKSLGNQLTSEKVKQANLLEPLPYEEPEIEDVEVVAEEVTEEVIPLQVPTIEKTSTIKFKTKENTAKKALEKAIKKKKEDDKDSQIRLF